MLHLFDRQTSRYCDRTDRRGFLKIGSLGFGFGSLCLGDLLRMEARAGVSSSTKALINIHLGGGPSHQDMWDLKPDAAVEYRGEFVPISTNVPGIEICEHLPRLATMADKYSLIRAMVGSVDEHSASTTQVGYRQTDLRAIGGAPGIGSVIAKLQGYRGGVPPYVSDGVDVSPGYLGPQFKPFSPNDAKEMLELKRIDAARLTRRAELLQAVDNIRREVDATGQFVAADAFTQKAVDVVLSGKMADALDLSKEPQHSLERYIGDKRGRLRDNERILRARRLVEAGVRCVALSWGGWDTHSGNFKSLREQLPALDQGLSTLIQDLSDRDMLDDVTIAVWGEFGRTPRVNSSDGGRDHWPRLSAAFLAGGGMQNGQVVGVSDRTAGDAQERPVHAHEVLATLYHNLGIPAVTTQIEDPAGRPRYLLEHREPIRELVG